MEITNSQYKKFSDLVYHECGINLHDGKQQLLKARLAKRLRKTGIHSAGAYLEILENDNQELIAFLDAISTNHTFFFRENQHFEILKKDHLKIWSAPCSSGEEPYSIAIDCLEKGFRPTIFATDISTNVLQMGKNGIYPIERAKNVPSQLLKRYFQRGNGRWDEHIRVKSALKTMVTFERFNLLSDPVPSREFDVVFCRNVLIYFDNNIKAKVVNKLYDAVKWNGYFIIGGAESLNSITHGYQYVRPSIYRKTR
jgi:chemotaxis protein methyltransferase CheR